MIDSQNQQHTETGLTASARQPVSVAIQPALPGHVKTPLLDAMREYDGLERLRFHVPGHAGQALVETATGPVPGITPENYRFDYTELEGMDVLSEPSECLAEAQHAAAEAFGVRESFFLVNGSTVGLMAGMLSLLQPGDQVLLPRNVHRSVLNGLILTGAIPVWMLPEAHQDWGLWGSVSVAAVEEQLQTHPDIKALVLTSPTYEGIGSDVAGLAEFCCSRNIRLVIDEAHGSLWPFSDQLPESACRFSCDLVIHSLHKTAGSLTQSAMAHLPVGSKIAPDVYQQALNILQTTSPSYLLLASLDAARAFLKSDQARHKISDTVQQVNCLRERLSTLKHFELFAPNKTSYWDPTKLFLRHAGLPGLDWAPRIEAEGIPDGYLQTAKPRTKIAYEAATPYGALYLASLGLKHSDYEQFFETMAHYDTLFKNQATASVSQIAQEAQNNLFNSNWTCLPEIVRTPREAFFAPGQVVEKHRAVGEIAKETIVHCPPGIPVLMPGERVLPRHLPYLPDKIRVLLE